MAPKEKDGCVKPVRGPISTNERGPETGETKTQEEAKTMMARVGRDAPDFEASAYVAGEGFVPVRLSSYRGKWIVLCFYPGDFTFV